MASLTMTHTHTHTHNDGSYSGAASAHPFYSSVPKRRSKRKPFLTRLLNRLLLVVAVLLDSLPGLADLAMRVVGPALVLGTWAILLSMHYVYYWHIIPAFDADYTKLPWSVITALGYALYFLIMYNHILAVFTPPGSIPASVPVPADIAGIIQREAATYQRGLTFTRHCRYCLKEKPPRAHHCHVCRQCVLRYDHHCVVEGSLISLADGTALPIEAVQPGMLVLGRHAAVGSEKQDGLVPVAVTARLDQGVRPCVELLFDDGRTLACTADHRIMTDDGVWVEAGKLVVGESDVTVQKHDASREDTVANKPTRVLPLRHVRLVARRAVGPKHVYDLAVPSAQGEQCDSFVANGVLVHNCPWIAGCIGYFNYRYFYLFMLYLWLGAAYISALTLPPILFPLPSRHSAISDTPLFLSFVVALATWCGLTGMLGLHTYLLMTNQTTLEMYVNNRRADERRKRSAPSAPSGRSMNVYDLGPRRNVEAILGRDRTGLGWLLCCLVPAAVLMPGTGTWFETRDDWTEHELEDMCV